MVKITVKADAPKMPKLPRIQREMNQCVQCGYCIDVCEAHAQTPWESVTPRGKIYYLNQLDKVGTGAMDKLLGRNVTLSPEFVDAMYKCTGCGNCEAVCHSKIHLVEFWEKVRTWLVKNGYGPMSAHKAMRSSIESHHNPYKEPESERTAWWPKDVEMAELPEVIFFAGCTGSYRMQDIARAGVTVLSRAGVSVSSLGADEWCCTSPLIRTGDDTLSLEFSKHTVETADGTGAKDMVMTCSGCYKTISHDAGRYYAKSGQNVYHFSQYVEKLISERKIPLNNEFKVRATYHDPCHLGRHAGVFDAPRNVIKKIKGIDFVEMHRSRELSRCCGAGGGYKSQYGNYAVDVATERIADAEEVGAEVIITCCPFCVLNLRAGAKKAGSKIKIMDLSEVLLQVTAPKVEEKEAVKAEKSAPKAAEEVPKDVVKATPKEVAKVEETPKEVVKTEAPEEIIKPVEVIDFSDEEESYVPEEAAVPEETYIDDYTDNSPEALVRRAAWNKGLRCRRDYGPHKIPVAFVRGKVAVFVEPRGSDRTLDSVLRSEGWTVLRYDEEDITDGLEQGEEINDAVRENLKSAKKKKKKR
ncbi:MAG: heterodisulfide reductase-related iron-sulfur binding cluster [Candidatus Methanomethylophilaceae archaeon]|jgi:heterodisulfide reductase subunit D